jgi:hypothetical protein
MMDSKQRSFYSDIYSYLKASTGFSLAAFHDCIETFIMAITKDIIIHFIKSQFSIIIISLICAPFILRIPISLVRR